MEALQELVTFLRDRNPHVRQVALENLASYTAKESPHRKIFFDGLQGGGLKQNTENSIIRDLKLLCRDQLSVAHEAFKALVNLSDSPLLVAPLTEPLFFSFLVSYIACPDAILADLACMLLSNLTSSTFACSALLSLQIPIIQDNDLVSKYYAPESRCGTCIAPFPYPPGDPKDVLALPLLFEAFLQGGVQKDTKKLRKGDLHFLASVFANVTQTPAGQRFFVEARPINPLNSESDQEYPLSKLALFTEHSDTMRRGGVISTIKNCAFQTTAHPALLSPESASVAVPPSTVTAPGVNAQQYILLALAGPEEFDLEEQERLPSYLQFLPPDKKREPDSTLRLTLIEALILLCTNRWGRDQLREAGTYEIVRAAHFVETVDKVSEHIEKLVQLLKGDEAPVVEIAAGDESDEDTKIEEV